MFWYKLALDATRIPDTTYNTGCPGDLPQFSRRYQTLGLLGFRVSSLSFRSSA